MFNKFRGMFGEEKRRMDLKPDELNQPRDLKNTNLESWMKESDSDGEMHGEVQEFLVGDLHEKHTSKLEVIQGGKSSEVSTHTAEPEVEKLDTKKIELEEKVAQAQAKFELAKAKLERAQAEMDDYKNARQRVEVAA